ncbi:MAG: ParA family protein [Thermomicrobiales bacterium]
MTSADVSSRSNLLSNSPDRRARIVAFTNQKGGVGKTTSTVNSSVILANRGLHVLLIDLDPQGNATSSVGVDKNSTLETTLDLLLDGRSVSDVAIVNVREHLDLCAATPTLATAELELVGMPNREHALRTALDNATGDYDVILVDCPPSLGLLTVNALTAADVIVIPIQCEFLALEGVGQLLQTVDLVKRHLNPELDVLGVLMTMYDGRTRLSGHVVQEVRKYFGERVFNTIVPRSVRLAEAPSYGQSITEYDPASRGGTAYETFADELLSRLGISATKQVTSS